jgi:signal transduction histidine kinase
LINASRRLVENLFISSKQLNQSNQEIRRIKQSGAEFMSKVSHDLRTPLNVIIGFSELMLDEVPGKINETQKQSLNDILNSAKRLVDLVNGFPDMKRRTSGKRE